jgi:hypothetical protein
VTDQNGKNVNDLDIKLALQAFIYAIQQNGTTVNFTLQPSGPPS